jgi:hypothetical protein
VFDAIPAGPTIFQDDGNLGRWEFNRSQQFMSWGRVD